MMNNTTKGADAGGGCPRHPRKEGTGSGESRRIGGWRGLSGRG